MGVERDEFFEVVDSTGKVTGIETRQKCHSDPRLAHRVAHVIVVNRRGEICLQKRSPAKDIQPGKWDTSVGGHLDVGETCEKAAERELWEELGVRAVALVHLHDYIWRSDRETEHVCTFLCRHEGPFHAHPTEITEVRFWKVQEIDAALGTGVFTPNFEEEYSRLKASGAWHAFFVQR